MAAKAELASVRLLLPVGRSLGSSTTASTLAHTTYRGYKIAEQALPEKYSDSTTTTELGSFLDKGLVQKVLSAMDDKGGDGVCPACNVGVQSDRHAYALARRLHLLGLQLDRRQS